jgi:hypothetical protein
MWIILSWTWGLMSMHYVSRLGNDGKNQASMVSCSIKSLESEKNSIDWLTDRSTCEHGWGVQCGRI